jgi:hypothetical protein
VFFRPFLIFFIELVELSVDRLVNLAHSFFTMLTHEREPNEDGYEFKLRLS